MCLAHLEHVPCVRLVRVSFWSSQSDLLDTRPHREKKPTQIPWKIKQGIWRCRKEHDDEFKTIKKMVPVSWLEICRPRKAHLSVLNILGEWQAVQWGKCHLLKRDSSDAGGAVLDEYSRIFSSNKRQILFACSRMFWKCQEYSVLQGQDSNHTRWNRRPDDDVIEIYCYKQIQPEFSENVSFGT